MSASIYAKITILFAVLTALLMALGYVVGLYFGDPLTFMLLGLILAAVFNFISYYYSDSIVVKISRAKIIQESDSPALFRAVRNVTQKAGIPMPKVGVVDSPQPNAFATGRGPDKAVVCATSSILQALTPAELEAVIGHEIGHVVHRDVLMSSIAATMAGAISYIGTLAMWSVWFGGGNSRSRNGGSPIFLLIAAILIPLGASFVQLGISRNDEYTADEYGAKLTREPGALISALTKISNMVHVRSFTRPGAQNPSPATGSLWIVNPFRGGTMMELFSTHPSLPHRVERLKKVAREMNLYVP
ncbi:MAG: M48 family metalloprotease [Nitrososphaerales archaeon]|nr:M48 family metalloprotease [Nitrososphaerales archaeon]